MPRLVWALCLMAKTMQEFKGFSQTKIRLELVGACWGWTLVLGLFCLLDFLRVGTAGVSCQGL